MKLPILCPKCDTVIAEYEEKVGIFRRKTLKASLLHSDRSVDLVCECGGQKTWQLKESEGISQEGDDKPNMLFGYPIVKADYTNCELQVPSCVEHSLNQDLPGSITLESSFKPEYVLGECFIKSVEINQQELDKIKNESLSNPKSTNQNSYLPGKYSFVDKYGDREVIFTFDSYSDMTDFIKRWQQDEFMPK